jgi:O-antigen ligase
MHQLINVVIFLFGGTALTSMAGLEITSSLIILLAIIDAIQSKQLRLIPPAVVIAGVSLLVVSLLSLAVNSHWNDMAVTAGWYRWIIFLIALVHLLSKNPQYQKSLIWGLFLGATLSGLNGLYQSFTGFDPIRGKEIIYHADKANKITRVTGFFNLPTTNGYILSMFLFLPLIHLSQVQIKKITRTDFFYALCFVLVLTNLVLTFTRGAWIAFFAGLLYFLYKEKKSLFVPIISTLVVTFILSASFSSGFRERLFSTFDTKYYSNSQRIEIWRANLAMFYDHPIWGVGFNKNDILIEEYHERLNHIEAYVSHAHNSYLQYLSGTGVVGFIIFVFFVLWLLQYGIRQATLLKSDHWQNKLFMNGIVAAQIAFLVGCMVDCNFTDAEVRYSYLIYIGLMLAVTQSQSPRLKN